MFTREGSHDHERGIRRTLWAYLLGSPHKLICWNSIKYNDSEQVPAEIDRRSHAPCVSIATAYCVYGYTILACQKSLLYSLCAVGPSSNSSSDISRFTWRREESVRSCDRLSGRHILHVPLLTSSLHHLLLLTMNAVATVNVQHKGVSHL